ncbi:MAG: acyltransferase domain-containing protein, partial [Candidatus Eremiobacterota bacterium]
ALRRLASHESPRWRHRSGIFFADQAARPGGEPVAFLFPGQGSQAPGMLAEACRYLPSVLDWFDDLDRAWTEQGLTPPSRILHLEPDPDLAAGVDLGGALTTVAGLALFEALAALEVSCAAMAGSSSGENAALMAAGAMRFGSRAELFRLLAGLFLESTTREQPRADFLAVSLEDRAVVEQLCFRFEGRLWVALDNCPRQLVLAGFPAAVQAAEAVLAEAGAFAFRLPFDRAFHTPLYAPVARQLEEEVYRHLAMAPPGVAVYGCADARPYPLDPEAVRRRAALQWCTTVRLRDTLLAMHADGIRHFVEVGPGGRLAGFCRDTLRGLPHSAWTTAAEGRSEMAQMLEVAAFLFCEGGAEPPRTRSGAPLLGPSDTVRLTPAEHPFLDHHRLGDLPVLPFSFAMELAAEAATRALGGVVVGVRRARAQRWMALPFDELTLHADVRTLGPDRAEVRLSDAFSAEVLLGETWPPPPAPRPYPEGPPFPLQIGERRYNEELFHGERMLTLSRGLRACAGGAEVELRLPPGGPLFGGRVPRLELSPTALDCPGHLAAYWLLQQGLRRLWLFPNEVESLEVYGPPPPDGSTLLARCFVRELPLHRGGCAPPLQGGLGRLDLDLIGPQDRLYARIDGFRCVWDFYPPNVFDWLLFPERGRRLSRPVEAPPGVVARKVDLPEEFLAGTGGIWRTALSRRALTRREREAEVGWNLLA